VTHMLRMVDNLLDVSRLDAGQFNLQLQRVNLVSLAQQVIEQQRPGAGDRELVLDPDEPELLATCDPLRIRQVVTNLVGNAIRYSPGATTVWVRLSTDRADLFSMRHPVYAHLLANHPEQRDTREMIAIISVQDQGAGISDEQAARLFKRYARGSERRAEGLGLGLYLSREFVARHGGDIWVEGVKNQGSTFYIVLPLRNSDEHLLAGEHDGYEPNSH